MIRDINAKKKLEQLMVFDVVIGRYSLHEKCVSTLHLIFGRVTCFGWSSAILKNCNSYYRDSPQVTKLDKACPDWSVTECRGGAR